MDTIAITLALAVIVMPATAVLAMRVQRPSYVLDRRLIPSLGILPWIFTHAKERRNGGRL